jgi:hypothetical protein
MKRGSTLFLRLMVGTLALIVLALCVFALPAGLRAENVGGYKPILIGMYITAVPFFVAVWQTFKLLDYIDKNQAFSEVSVKALQVIKYCGAIVSVIYGLGMPYIFMVADRDDAPGVVMIGLIFTFGPLAVAVCAAVLQRLLHNAIAIKAQNDEMV